MGEGLSESVYEPRELEIGALDLERGRICRHDGTTVGLTWLELKMLRYLADRPGQVVGLEELYEQVWGYASSVSSRAIDKTTSRLRKKMEQNSREPVHLLRVPGRGLSLALLPELSADLPVSRADAFIGRAPQIATLKDQTGSGRLVTVVGPGGVGKTRLVQAFTAAHGGPFPGGVFAVDLSHAATVADIEARMAWALSIPGLSSGLADALPLAIEARGAALFVLESFEHLVRHAEQTVGLWSASAPEAAFLVTSRVPLLLAGEQQLRLDGLPVDEAGALFEARASGIRHGFSITDENQGRVEDLMSRLDGNPLAIEMAAARSGMMSVGQLLEQLDRRWELLRGTRRDRPERHRSLWATIAWSWELLSREEQVALWCASVFVSPFTPVAAVEVFPGDGGTTLDLLQQLVDKSLLQCIEGERDDFRFKMSESVRAFAMDRFESDTDGSRPDLEALRGRLARHYAALHADLQRPSVIGAVRDHELKRLTLNLENLMVGARQADDLVAAVKCCRAAFAVLRWRGPLSRLADLIRFNLDRCEPGTEAEGVLWLLQAMVARMTSDWPGCQRAAERARERFAALGLPFDESTALTVLGLAQVEQGQLASARACLTAAQAMRQTREPLQREQATTLANLGYLELRTGRSEVALAHYREALDLFQQTGDRVGEGAVLDKLCNLYWTLGDLERSRWYGERALEMHRLVGNRQFEAIALGNLGTLHHQLEQFETADERYREAHQLHGALGNAFGVCISLVYQASLARDQRQWEAAGPIFDEALRMAKRLGAKPLQLRALTEWGALELETASHAAATELLERAEGLAREMGEVEALGRVLGYQGLVAVGQGDSAMARRRCAEAAEISTQLDLRADARLVRLVERLSLALEPLG